jgi:hypothetical protein
MGIERAAFIASREKYDDMIDLGLRLTIAAMKDERSTF